MTTPASDFDPAVRASAWWSGDSRKAADGKASEAILIKLGLLDPPDLSGNEAVQMGHVMEPVILGLAQQRLGAEVRKIDHAYAHKTEPWLRSHFDGLAVVDGKEVLIEAKNYGAHQRQKFDADAGVVPAADYAQCLHEATVYGTDTVYLAVLLGGQEFCFTKLIFSNEQKTEFIKSMAQHWAKVASRTPPEPSNPDEARVVWPVSQQAVVEASRGLEEACARLKMATAARKDAESREEELKVMLQKALQERDTLVDISGKVLATWKSAAASRKFDATLFQQAFPDLYQQFIREVPGSRRFLVK
jgi:predicted phage-related endonuclease